jgi:hypothetical protein
MPLTMAHAAAAMPLRRLNLPLVPLIGGCLAPDLPYYLGWMALAPASHHPVTGTILAIPLGWSIVLMWWCVRRPWAELAPAVVRRRLPPAAPWRDAHWLRWSAALLCGAMSHIAWDAWTHADGLMVRMVPLLAAPWPWYRVLQHGSTVIGSALVLHWMWRWYRDTPPSRPDDARLGRRWRRGGRCWLACAVAGALLLALARGAGQPAAILWYGITGGVAALGAASLLFAGAYGWLGRAPLRRADAPDTPPGDAA